MWSPGYYDKYGNFIQYEKHWFCNTNKVIHQNEKQSLNCNDCNPKEIKIMEEEHYLDAMDRDDWMNNETISL